MNKNVCKSVYDEIRVKYGIPEKIHITQPEDLLQILLISRVSGDKQESFIVVTLDGNANVIKSRVITKGLLNHSLVHPREVYRSAILDNAHSIICAHNHPSGNLEPSAEDIKITDQLKKAGDIIGISLIDHVIISKTGIQSLRGMGYI